ncbi:CHAD domain containing protein [Thermus sp. CCB_US3_UF1]|uniref:CHAD domain-containing protein n=1 Tax=Thermus sp. CCB_US3_UF1 TaxID=1111069 RepID=UPI000238A057|nr:CHAD domain-containing protein [Thermus sp. CCB_US3_UF1]AEV16180.1 CHAD domain containing protein [Thermus sp. CCB_US3_UF1]
MRTPREWVDHLEAHLPLALSGADPEGVHQVRVAGRRLRAYLNLLGWRVLQDDLRRLVRGAGRVRDLEVALGHPLPPGFRAHLEEEVRQAREALPPLLASPWTAALLRALRVLPPLGEEAWGRLRRQERRAEARLKALQAEPSLEALHAYRRALRRVRYAKEFLGLSAKREKALQEALGGLQDLEVLLGLLEGYLAQAPDPEGEALRAELLARRQEALAGVLEALREA